MRGKYDFSLSGSAPRRYPAESVNAELLLADGTSTSIPRRTLDRGWGEGKGTYAVGADHKSPPVGVELAWFSYAENTFYGGRAIWPGEPIAALMAEGTTARDGYKSKYSLAMFGFAPGGYYTVWLSGAGRKVAIGHGTMPEIEMDWGVMGITREGATRLSVVNRRLSNGTAGKTLEQVAEEGIPYGRWERYHTPYPWRIEPLGGGMLEEAIIYALNGERFLADRQGHFMIDGPQALPRKLQVVWPNEAGQSRFAYVLFDPDEIMEAAELLGADGRPLILRVDTSTIAFAIDTYLHDGDQVVHLQKTRLTKKATDR